jgi:hypothetical protein
MDRGAGEQVSVDEERMCKGKVVEIVRFSDGQRQPH